MNCSLLPPTPILAGEVALGLRLLAHPLAVQSSLLASVAYDHHRAILQLEFGYGVVYQYFGVPVQSYRELLQAPSHGAYFNRHIRSLFRYVLLPPA
jgi:KTSC domain